MDATAAAQDATVDATADHQRREKSVLAGSVLAGALIKPCISTSF